MPAPRSSKARRENFHFCPDRPGSCRVNIGWSLGLRAGNGTFTPRPSRRFIWTTFRSPSRQFARSQRPKNTPHNPGLADVGISSHWCGMIGLLSHLFIQHHHVMTSGSTNTNTRYLPPPYHPQSCFLWLLYSNRSPVVINRTNLTYPQYIILNCQKLKYMCQLEYNISRGVCGKMLLKPPTGISHRRPSPHWGGEGGNISSHRWPRFH